MIPPRGCAYVVMDRRQDGYKALQKLKNLKLQGSSVKVSIFCTVLFTHMLYIKSTILFSYTSIPNCYFILPIKVQVFRILITKKFYHYMQTGY